MNDLLKIHFLKVGNGDCTVIQLPDASTMVVDIMNARMDNSHDNLYENPIHYMKRLSVSSIKRYVQTHPDMDHMDGLSSLAKSFSIENFWDTKNTKDKPEEFSNGFRETDWDKYRELGNSQLAKCFERSTSPITPDNGKYQYDLIVLNPSNKILTSANQKEDWNMLSYVLLLKYNNFKLVLGGDATEETWSDIYNWMLNDPTAKSLLSNVTIFKASHHGRKSGYCGIDMLKVMNPQKIILSKGSIPQDDSAYNNYYNFYGKADHLYSTSVNNVVCSYDGNTTYNIS